MLKIQMFKNKFYQFYECEWESNVANCYNFALNKQKIIMNYKLSGTNLLEL